MVDHQTDSEPRYALVPTNATGTVTALRQHPPLPPGSKSSELQGRVVSVPGSNGEKMFLPIAPLPGRLADSNDGSAARPVQTHDSAVVRGTSTSGIGIDTTTATVSSNGNAALSPLTDSTSFLGDFDPNLDDSEYPPGPGRKKRKTPAFQLSSYRHDGCAVYDGDVIDGTDRHNKLAPIMLDPPLAGHQRIGDGADDDDDDDEDQDQDGGFRERYGRNQNDGERVYTNPDSPSTTTSTGTSTKPKAGFTSSRLLKPVATQTCEFRKLLFLRRKAALITLFLDATSAIKSYWKDEKSASTVNMSKTLLSKLPEVDSFEKLLPALEDVCVGGWPPDQPGWRAGEETEVHKRYGGWKGKFAKRRRLREERKEIVRGGWAPEGSFEFERSSKAGGMAREGAKARAALQRLAIELRHILLTVKPATTTSTSEITRSGDGDSPTKTKRRTGGKNDENNVQTNEATRPSGEGAPQGNSGTETKTANGGDPMERVLSGSKDGSEGGSGTGGKKKPKKKKRSVLANQSNPHHVNNYRSTRTLTSAGDPNEPYPSHASLLFPPSMSFLSARPGGNRVRASEEDYICSFCEYDLFYGTERQRKAAIRRRRQELKRKENIKNKAKGVADGKAPKEDESEYDDDDDDMIRTEECEDQGYGKCSCGRALGPNGDKSHHLKPPDPDPWPDPFPNGIPERPEDLPRSPGGSYMIPVLPPVLQNYIEAEAERQLEEERQERERLDAQAKLAEPEGEEVDEDQDQEVSRASTPSID